MRKIKREKVERLVGWFVFITLLFSVGYSVYGLIHAPAEATGQNSVIRSDYLLMLLQCLLGLLVLMLPGFLRRRMSVSIPHFMNIMYFLFLYCAIYLGEIRSFYYLVPHWDTILHAFSGAMLGALGFIVVRLLNDTEKIRIQLSPAFVALFAFCFALALGSVWEIYEFCGDTLFSLNMQKYRLAGGQDLVGQAALRDTMKDIIVDAVAAFVVSLLGYLTMIRKEKRQ